MFPQPGFLFNVDNFGCKKFGGNENVTIFVEQKQQIMKQIHLEKTEGNINWCKANLMEADYKILAGKIVIFYNYDFQKQDILKAIGK